MKYIQTYEGTKSKMMSKINLHNKLSQFIPGMYIIFYTDVYKYTPMPPTPVGVVIIGKIEKINHTEPKKYSSETPVDTISINMTDMVSEYEQNNYKIYMTRDFPVSNIKKTFLITASFFEAMSKYQEIKEEQQKDWELEHNASKYNL